MPQAVYNVKVKADAERGNEPLNSAAADGIRHGGPQPKQQHHCPVCGKIPSRQCFKAGHLVRCPVHGTARNPRNACVRCAGEEERARAAAAEAAALAASAPPPPDPWALEKKKKKEKKADRKSKRRRSSSQ